MKKVSLLDKRNPAYAKVQKFKKDLQELNDTSKKEQLEYI